MVIQEFEGLVFLMQGAGLEIEHLTLDKLSIAVFLNLSNLCMDFKSQNGSCDTKILSVVAIGRHF